MPYSWDSRTIIDDLADEDCFRALFLQEVEAVAEQTGHRFVADANFDTAMSRCATLYRDMLQNMRDQTALAGDGAIAAVRAMYLYLHRAEVDPTFERAGAAPSENEFECRLFSISSRALVAHNFCYRFLVVVGWYHYQIEMFDEDVTDVDALIETTIGNFQSSTTFSFEQMRARAFRHHRWVPPAPAVST